MDFCMKLRQLNKLTVPMGQNQVPALSSADTDIISTGPPIQMPSAAVAFALPSEAAAADAPKMLPQPAPAADTTATLSPSPRARAAPTAATAGSAASVRTSTTWGSDAATEELARAATVTAARQDSGISTRPTLLVSPQLGLVPHSASAPGQVPPADLVELEEITLRLRESVTEIAELVRKATLHHQLLSGQYAAVEQRISVRAALQSVIARHKQIALLQDRVSLTIAEDVPHTVVW